MSQILIDLISQGIHMKQDKEFPDLTCINKSITKSFLLPGTNIKLDMRLLILFSLIIFVHLKFNKLNINRNIKLHNTKMHSL